MNPRIHEKVSRAVEAGAFEEHESGLLLPGLGLIVGGVFTHEVMRAGVSLGKFVDRNLIVNEGLNNILDAALGGTTPEAAWYVGIFENAGYTPAAANTAATIAAAATEITTAYTSATRPAWQKAGGGLPDASNQSITNSTSKASFVFTAEKTVQGAFLVSASAKNAVTGKLVASSKFSVARVCAIDDELLVTYTLTAQTAP